MVEKQRKSTLIIKYIENENINYNELNANIVV